MKNDLVLDLERLAQERPEHVMRRLELGTRISKNVYQGNFIYEIDDINIFKMFCSFSSFDDDSFNDYVVAVGKALRVSEDTFQRVFPPRLQEERHKHSVVPFSRAVKEGLGECVEKSILVQLALQDQEKAFMIKGRLSHPNGGEVTHAYNVVVQDRSAYLIDAQNPMAVHTGGDTKIVPFIVPVEELREDIFVVLERWSARRVYSLMPSDVHRKGILDLF